MQVITYRITLQEPTLVTALEGDPNSGVAFDYLPGSVLRSALIGKYLRKKNLRLDQFDAANAGVRRLFFDGTTRFLNGYILDRLDRRTLPTPTSWQRSKGVEEEIFDFAVEPPDDEDTQWQGISKPFGSLIDDMAYLVQPDRHISVHTARTRRFGRAMPRTKILSHELPGAVYRYNALAAGQTFEAAILCDLDADAEIFVPLLEDEALLGGSRSGGYGRATLHHPNEAPPNWREVCADLMACVDGNLIITLLSNALLRDENGQFVVDPSAITKILTTRLGAPLSLQRAFLRGEAVGGFNRKWGLPLPQTIAVQMGSVLVYNTPPCDVRQLQEIEMRGIGERRAEGFGRVAFNCHVEAKFKVDTTKRTLSVTPITIPQGTDSENLAKRMVERMLRQRLDERLSASANAISITNAPSNAQLSRLRSILQDELMRVGSNLQRVGEFLIRVKERNSVRKQFERARVGSERLIEWLERIHRTTSENEWKALLGLQPGDVPKIGDIKSSLTNALRTEYVLRLIIAVLARAAKARRKEAE